METDLDDQQRQRVDEFRRKHRIALLTMLFTDIVGSTGLKQALGDRAAIALIERHHALLREALGRFAEAEEIDTAGDSFFCVFAKPSDAAHFALIVQRGVRDLARETGFPVLDRIGIHVGEVFVHQRSEGARDLFGIQIDTTARIMSLGGADQILLSRFAFDNARQVLRGHDLDGVGELSWLNHGYYEMKGVEEPVEVCEVGEIGAGALLAPGDSEKAHRFHSPDAEPVLGWRPAAGQRVPNTQWTLERALGEGGFGEVWLARHETLKQRRVIKFCFRADRVRSLKREVTLFRILRERVGEQRGIVTVHDVFFDEPPYYIVMDYVDGPNLAEWTAAHAPLAEVPLATRLEIVAQVADALQVAHDAGVIHRDVKPSNILVAEEKGELRVKLTDFGIGQVVSAEALAGITKLGFTQTMLSSSNGTGTQLYMAPELLTGLPATTRSDLYSLGVVLYQLIIGDLARPVTADWPDDIADPLLREDLRKCLAGDAAKRFAGASQLATHLRELPARQAAREQEQQRIAALERSAYRRGILRVAGFATLAVALFAALAAIAFRQTGVARKSSAEAVQSAHAAAAEREKSEAMLTKMQLQHAEELFTADDASGGLAFLAAVLRRHPSDRITASRLLSALRERSYPRPIAIALPHGRVIYAAEWSEDGHRLLTVTGNAIRMWNVTTGKPVFEPIPVQHMEDVRFSPDGRRFIAIGVDSQVFDSQSGKPVTGLLEHKGRSVPGEVNAIHAVFSPDGNFVATTTNIRDVRVWKVETGEVVASLALPELPSALAYSPDGAWLAIGDARGTVHLWDTATQKVAKTWKETSEVVGWLFFTPDSEHLLAEWNNLVAGFDLSAKQPLAWKIIPEKGITSLDLSPDGHTLAIAETDHVVRFWEADTGKAAEGKLQHSRYVQRVRYSRDGARIFTITQQPAAQVWDVFAKQPICAPCTTRSAIGEAELSPDGRRLAVSAADGIMRLWEITPAEAQPIVFPQPASPEDLNRRLLFALHPDQRRMAVAFGTEAQIFDAETGRKIGSPIEHTLELGRAIWSLAFQPHGEHLLTAGSDMVVRQWDCRTHEVAGPELPSTGYIGGLSFSKDGHFLCVQGNAQKARVWDLVRGVPVTPDLGGGVKCSQLTPDGNRVVIPELAGNEGGNQNARVYDTASGAPHGQVCELHGTLYSLAISNDGRAFATGTWEGRARVWRIEDGAPLTPWLEHHSAIAHLNFSTDGHWLATASSDHTARIWSVADGKPAGATISHNEAVYSAVFSPDGRRLATSSYDGTVRLWDVPSGRSLSDRLPVRSQFVDMLKWTEDGRRLIGGGIRGFVHSWDVPPVESDAPSWLPVWAEAVGGLRLDQDGDLVPLGTGEDDGFLARVAALEGNDVFTRAAKWFYTPLSERSISPFSAIRMPDYTRQLCEAGNSQAAALALRFAPGDARAWASWCEAEILSMNSSDAVVAAKLKFCLTYAEGLAPTEPLVWNARAALLKKLGDSARALSASRHAAELNSDDSRIQRRLAYVLAEQGENSEAVERVSNAIRQDTEGRFTPAERRKLLGFRGDLLFNLGRREEAARDRIEILGIAARDPAATPNQINLSLHYNLRLDDNTGSGKWHNYGRIPTGLQTFAGTQFDVRGIIQLNNYPRDTRPFPKAVNGIVCGQTCGKLHFLHASADTYDQPNAVVAAYVVHYSDGAQIEIPLRLAHEISDRYTFTGQPHPPPPIIAWSGGNAFTDQQKYHQISLFKFTWENPHPEIPVQSIDFIKKSENCAPLLVAITAE